MQPYPLLARPGQAQRQRQVDAGRNVVDSLGLLFGAPSGQDHCRSRRAQQVGRPFQFRFGHARDPLHAFRPVGRDRRPHPLKSLSALRHVPGVNHPVADEDVQQPIGEDRVGSRHQAQVKVRALRRGGQPGVGDNQLPAVAALRLKVLHHGRHGFRGVVAHEQDHFGAGDVLHREGQAAVNPQRPDARRRGR